MIKSLLFEAFIAPSPGGGGGGGKLEIMFSIRWAST